MTMKNKSWYRSTIQIFFFALVVLITINSALEKSGASIPLITSASLHAICPFGGVVSLYKLATVGTFLQKIHESSFILMTIAFILTLAFGPVICSWVCPFGTFQEWLGKVGKKIFVRKYNNIIPAKFDIYLRYLRYIVLTMVIYKTAVTAKLMFQDVDPYFALFNFWSDEVTITSLVVLGATMLLSLLVERPWCKYACPYGALLGLFNLIKIFKIRRVSSTCINCKACDRACPMNISVSSSTAVMSHQCISCMKCTSEIACPIDATVELSQKGLSWKGELKA